jgi:hypothetical protein
MTIIPNALNALTSNSQDYSLMNPFQVKGLYPFLRTSLESLPFEVPNPSLLANLPYFFNIVSKWTNQTYYQQVIDTTSTWHAVVDGCTIEELILPLSTGEFTTLEGPIHIKTINLETSLSFDSQVYSLQITKYVGETTQRITHEFHAFLFFRVYVCIQDAVVRSYMAVVKDILNAQSDNEIEIKGYSIKYVSGMLYINNQAYENIDLPIVAWLMYILFN